MSHENSDASGFFQFMSFFFFFPFGILDAPCT